jgi:hypothetical protein
MEVAMERFKIPSRYLPGRTEKPMKNLGTPGLRAEI